MGNVSKEETEEYNRSTNSLDIRGQAMLAGRNQGTKQSHSLTGGQRTGNVSMGETEQQSRVTDFLNGRGQAMLAGIDRATEQRHSHP